VVSEGPKLVRQSTGDNQVDIRMHSPMPESLGKDDVLSTQ
jgi:hypothetical protein